MEHTKGNLRYAGKEDGDFILFIGKNFVCNVGQPIDIVAQNDPKVELIAFDLDLANAFHLVLCWNEYDSLKAKADVCDEVLENLLHIIRLLCHPGSHVMAKDIDSAKEIIAKAGKNVLWGI